MIKGITSTFVVRVTGDSMEKVGISDGDELIVNRAGTQGGSVVVAVLDCELTIKRLRITAAGMVLQAEKPATRTSATPPWPTSPFWASPHGASSGL